jgi:hypothetical protein
MTIARKAAKGVAERRIVWGRRAMISVTLVS